MMSSNKGNKKNIENLTNEVGRALSKFRKYCIDSGMKDNAIDAMIEGKEVIDCFYCKTFNMYEIFYNEKHNWDMYQCANCDKTWFVDLNKK